jgi:hypothetical protein
MDQNDLSQMMQSTLGLIGIVTDLRDHEPEQVMDGLMRMTSQLQKAYDSVVEEMRTKRRPDEIIGSMMRPNVLAAQFHAEDLLAVNARASRNFAPLLGDDKAKLTPEAQADVMVWLSVANQTLIALKLLFQVSRLYGRAPNGKLLARSPSASDA